MSVRARLIRTKESRLTLLCMWLTPDQFHGGHLSFGLDCFTDRKHDASDNLEVVLDTLLHMNSSGSSDERQCRTDQQRCPRRHGDQLYNIGSIHDVGGYSRLDV